MAEIKWGNREVQKITQKTGYVEVQTMDGKGKVRNERLKSKDHIAIVTAPGAYQFAYEIGESGYPEIVDVRVLDLNSISKASNPQPTNQTSPSSFKRELDPNTKYQNDSITAQVAIKSATEFYTGKEVTPDRVISLAEGFMNSAKKMHENGEIVPF